jgi:excinuclease ABC subunit B
MSAFEVVSRYEPMGDQPHAIDEISSALASGERFQTLLGVTGSGKTFTMANVIARVGLPTLIVSHNKTLAAQLYSEFRGFFPNNAVGYFVSYYDYYQPEAYVPATDTYIEKDATINEDIDRLRLKATADLIARDDVIIIASVSCIYGLGDPKSFSGLGFLVERGAELPRDRLLRNLVGVQYSRNDMELRRGTFRVRGDVVEIYPAYEEHAVRVEMFGDEIEAIREIDPLTGKTLDARERVMIYPAKHFVTTRPRLEGALETITRELDEQHGALLAENKLLEADRLWRRTRYDMEMLREVGYCPGIENYSRHMDGRAPGTPPHTLIDYFPDEFLLIVDESHVTIPQMRAMYVGDHSRKSTLVDYGFRLPSALDNRPLRFEELEGKLHQTVFVSATPGDWELEKTGGVFVEQVIRPTGLVDPSIEVRPVTGQMDDLLEEVRARAARKERVLVTTLTKRMAEDLTDYFAEMGVRVRYIHADVDAIERVQLLRGLRLAEFDVLVGINLLREGLDLPEVSLVAILDADKEGYLRSARSLIQTAGRAARNAEGTVIFYADTITRSMEAAMSETNRRRTKQLAFNEEHGIVPRTVTKSLEEIMAATSVADAKGVVAAEPGPADKLVAELDHLDPKELIEQLTREMLEAADALEFEKAASLRDRIEELRSAVPS